MGGMKDEAKRMTTPPLFPRVHVNDTRRGNLSQPFDNNNNNNTTMSMFKESNSILSLSLPPTTTSINVCNTRLEDTLKLHGKVNKKGVNYPNSRGVAAAATKANPIKLQNEYKLNNFSFKSLDSLQVPIVKRSETEFCLRKDPQTNTDLSLQFSTSTGKPCLEDARHMKSRRNLVGFNNETQKKLKTVPEREQIVDIDIDSHENTLENSAIDSLLGLNTTSSNVVKMIGDKRFWKMRTYMINQQKIFAEQVFELHRLIMVQKMVAKSPNLILEHNKSKMKSTHLPEMASKLKPNTEKLETLSEYPQQIKPNLPLPCLNQEHITPKRNNPPVIKGQQQQQTWFQPPPSGNQWLVPVISPSEGLVYKPYGPSSGYMVPVYDDSLDTTFRFPVNTTPQQFGHTYFSPNVTIEQTSGLQKWSNTSSHMTQAIPFSIKKSQESNDSEVHGSTASSPPEKNKWDVLLPLFPTEPTHRNDDNKTQTQTQFRAIKAIPHNPNYAFESAARIFRSIQEERRDSEYMIR